MATIPAVFVNTSGEDKYTVPSNVLLIPQDSVPSNLSDLINHLLPEDEETSKFRFFVQGTLLQGPLNTLLEQLTHPSEVQVRIEYSPVPKLPEDHREQKCPDWIRCIRATEHAVLSGSFDSIIRKHSSISIVKEYVGHKNCVTALETIDSKSFVSGSNDWSLRWWNLEEGSCKAVLKGHQASVQCLAYDPGQRLVVSGDATGKMAFWSLDEEKIVLETEKPVRKKAKSLKKVASAPEPVLKSLAMVSAHKDGYVAALAVSPEGKLISAGLDHRLHVWDLSSRTKTSTLTLGNQVSAMDCGKSLLVLGSPDGHVKLFDSRELKAVCGSVKLHDGWINAVKWSPMDENHFCTVGADLRVCVWDRRGLASGPLKVLSHGEKRMLGLDWSASGIFYGGEDCKLHSWS